jgi:hypothetical protein
MRILEAQKLTDFPNPEHSFLGKILIFFENQCFLIEVFLLLGTFSQGCGSAFNADPDPAFFLFADPDPDDQKIKKKLQLKKMDIFW